jgi:hypothetical protein
MTRRSETELPNLHDNMPSRYDDRPVMATLAAAAPQEAGDERVPGGRTP